MPFAACKQQGMDRIAVVFRKPHCGRCLGCSRLQPHVSTCVDKSGHMSAQSQPNALRTQSTHCTNLRITTFAVDSHAQEYVEPSPPTALPQLWRLSARQFRLRLQFSRTPSPRLPEQPEGQGMAFAVSRRQCRQPPRSFRRRSSGYQPGSQRTGHDCLAVHGRCST